MMHGELKYGKNDMSDVCNVVSNSEVRELKEIHVLIF